MSMRQICPLKQWFSSLGMPQDHLQGMLKQIASLNQEFLAEGVGGPLRICICNELSGDADSLGKIL